MNTLRKIINVIGLYCHHDGQVVLVEPGHTTTIEIESGVFTIEDQALLMNEQAVAYGSEEHLQTVRKYILTMHPHQAVRIKGQTAVELSPYEVMSQREDGTAVRKFVAQAPEAQNVLMDCEGMELNTPWRLIAKWIAKARDSADINGASSYTIEQVEQEWYCYIGEKGLNF